MKFWIIGAAVFATSVTVASIHKPSPIHAMASRQADTSLPGLVDTIRLDSRWGLTTTLVPQVESIVGNHSRAALLSLAPGLRHRLLGVSRDTANERTSRYLTGDPTSPLPLSVSTPDVRTRYVTGVIARSLFEDATQAGLSEDATLDLVQIFGWDIDFALEVTPGDRFTVVLEEKYWRGQRITSPEIVAAEFVNRGISYKAVRFPGIDGKNEYYTVTGRNLRRPFLKTPVKFNRVSSLFAKARFHPVLKVWRAHTGVDYAAPTGTPVRATADGKVAWRGWYGGYGKTVVIDHGQSHSTLYAHLSEYRADLKKGDVIKQGEIIGRVGSTGLASGPHLHYEFLVNGRHQNPLTLDFPASASVPTARREEFFRVTQQWVVRLNQISRTTIAAR